MSGGAPAASIAKLCTAREAAKILNSPLPTIYYLVKVGRLPGFRIGGRWKFRQDQLMELVRPVSFPKVADRLSDDRAPDRTLAMADNRVVDIAKKIAAALQSAEMNPNKSNELTFCLISIPAGHQSSQETLREH